MSQHALDLPVDGFHRMRQKTFKSIMATLFYSEARAFVPNGAVQQRNAPQGMV